MANYDDREMNLIKTRLDKLERIVPSVYPEVIIPKDTYVIVRGGNTISVLGGTGVKFVDNVPDTTSLTLDPGVINWQFTQTTPPSPTTFPDGLGYGDLVVAGKAPERVIIGNWRYPFTTGGDFYRYFSPLQQDILAGECISLMGKCRLGVHTVYVLGGL